MRKTSGRCRTRVRPSVRPQALRSCAWQTLGNPGPSVALSKAAGSRWGDGAVPSPSHEGSSFGKQSQRKSLEQLSYFT